MYIESVTHTGIFRNTSVRVIAEAKWSCHPTSLSWSGLVSRESKVLLESCMTIFQTRYIDISISVYTEEIQQKT